MRIGFELAPWQSLGHSDRLLDSKQTRFQIHLDWLYCFEQLESFHDTVFAAEFFDSLSAALFSRQSQILFIQRAVSEGAQDLERYLQHKPRAKN